MSEQETNYDVIVVLYEGQKTAEKAYGTLQHLEQMDQLDLHSAALICRQPNGKLKIEYKRRPAIRRGVAAGGAIGLLVAGIVAGPVLAATAAGAAVGAAIGAARAPQRRALREVLETRLGTDDSALAVMIAAADWLRVVDRTSHYGGEVLQLELTPESRSQLEQLIPDSELLARLRDVIEVDEEES